MMRRFIAMFMVTSSLFVTSAVAADVDHVGCANNLTVYVDDMGIVNEGKLQEHIEQAKKSLSEIRGTKAGSEQRRYLLSVHLTKMQQALEEMHNLKLKSDCPEAAHGASLETRVSVLEKRMDMILDMLEQMIGYQQESAPQ